MKKSVLIAPAVLVLTLAFAAPVFGQDVAEEGEAAAMETMESHNEMMGEGCECECMKGMHEKMMKMHGEEGHAEGMAHDADAGHAEGMDSDEAHAEMQAAHTEMMAGCKCMSGDKGEGEHAMSCKMHGEHGDKGEMKGEGMQHRHGMEAEESAETDTES